MSIWGDDGLGDWRIAAATRLTADVPAAFPGGPSYKAGTPVYQATHIERNGGYFGFTLPSAPAMAFNVAIDSNKCAMVILRSLEFHDTLTPDGQGKGVSHDHIENLYNFFERCMISATFSFQALEAYCNHAILTKLKESMVINRGGKKVQMSPSEIERQLPTPEKLSVVLPKLYGVPTPKGKKVWEPYKRLQAARDSTIHLKAYDQYASYNESLFVKFLDGEFNEYPSAAANMIRHFVGDDRPRWLKVLEGRGI